MFSRQRVRQLLPLLQEKLANMLHKFEKYRRSGQPLNLMHAYMALAEDMISEYSFGICGEKLESPEFNDILYHTFLSASRAARFSMHFPSLGRMMNSLPDWITLMLNPALSTFFKVRDDLEKEITNLMSPSNEQTVKRHATVMQEVLNNPSLPPSEKTHIHLSDEAQLIFGAGLITTGWSASVAIYHILANPKILARLRQKLFTVIPPLQKHLDCSDMDWSRLEALPYFQACIKEALRLSCGTTVRLSRRTPREIIYTESLGDEIGQGRKWRIPANATVSISIYLHNHSEKIFPDSHVFNPDRWLTTPRIPENYFVTFSKGSRICLGMQLAWAKLSLMLAGTIRWFDLELYRTTERDAVLAYDFGFPAPWEGSQGVRTRVVREAD